MSSRRAKPRRSFPLGTNLTPALGIEHFDDKVFANLSLHGGLWSGVVLEKAVKRAPHWLPWFAEMGMPDELRLR